jgi:hypothetical protein
MEIITPICIVCHKSETVTITEEQFHLLNHGELIQNIFPDWNEDERELLISGTHSACWDTFMPDEEESQKDMWDEESWGKVAPPF